MSANTGSIYSIRRELALEGSGRDAALLPYEKKAHKRHKTKYMYYFELVKNNHIKKSIQIKNVIDDIRK